MEKQETIKLKKVTTSDIELLQKISRITFSDTFGEQNTAEDLQKYLSTAYATNRLLDEINNPNSYFYFAYLRDELCGYLKLNVESAQTENKGGNSLEIERIYVLPSQKRKGVGSALINEANHCAYELNKNVIWLGVWEHNQGALAFYNHFGFEKFGEHTFVLGEDHQKDFLMQKKL